MRQRLIRLSVLFLSALMGWALGFIKLPFIEENYSFWVGFVGCLGMLVFVLALFSFWNNKKDSKLFETVNKLNIGSLKQGFVKDKILISFFFMALLMCCLISYLSNNRIKARLNYTEAELNDLKYTVNLDKQKSKISLLLDLINKLDSTMLNFQDKASANLMIDRIVALSTSFKIYKEWDMENKVFQSISVERGLLLLALVHTKMDTNYFNKIKENVSFSGADLRNADFHGLNLSGIELKNANLNYANLEEVNLNNANLNGASLVGVNLNQASLVGANLIAAKLNWAKVNAANLCNAKLDSANFSNATVQKSKLNNASLIQTIICNAIFHESDLSNSLLSAINMSNANLTKTILTNAEIYNTNLGNTILHDAIVHNNWTEPLIRRNNSGVNTLLEKYYIVCDSLLFQDSIICRLTPISH